MSYMILVFSLSLVLNLEPSCTIMNVKGPQLKDPVGVEIQSLLHSPNLMPYLLCLEEKYFS